jgi:hypothetical protein
MPNTPRNRFNRSALDPDQVRGLARLEIRRVLAHRLGRRLTESKRRNVSHSYRKTEEKGERADRTATSDERGRTFPRRSRGNGGHDRCQVGIRKQNKRNRQNRPLADSIK